VIEYIYLLQKGENFMWFFNKKSKNDKQKLSSTEDRISIYNNKFDYMDGNDFELFVAQILRKIGFSNIQLTKESGDQGVDIIAERDGIKYAIQCKRYSQAVGNKAVQEVFAGKTFYHCHVGVVVTNNYFTKAAKDLARENGIVLWDRDFLNTYVGETTNEELKNNSIRILDEEERIVAIEDGEISRFLFHYIEEKSRICIDMYLKNGDENIYMQEMIDNVEYPILFYNAKFIKIRPDVIQFVYYCSINQEFKFTKTFEKFNDLSAARGGKYTDDLFEIEVFWEVKDIVLCNTEVKIIKFPEISITTSDIETIRSLEDLDEFDLQNSHKVYVNENLFPIKIDNIQI